MFWLFWVTSARWAHSKLIHAVLGTVVRAFVLVTGGRPYFCHAVTYWRSFWEHSLATAHCLGSLSRWRTVRKTCVMSLFILCCKSRNLISKHTEILVRNVGYHCERLIIAAPFPFCLVYVIISSLGVGVLFGYFLDGSKKTRWKDDKNNACWFLTCRQSNTQRLIHSKQYLNSKVFAVTAALEENARKIPILYP